MIWTNSTNASNNFLRKRLVLLVNCVTKGLGAGLVYKIKKEFISVDKNKIYPLFYFKNCMCMSICLCTVVSSVPKEDGREC